MHHPTDRIAYTTAFVTQVMEHWLEREIAQWVHLMKDRTMSECSYHSGRMSTHGVTGHWIDPIELFLIPHSAGVMNAKVCGLSCGRVL